MADTSDAGSTPVVVELTEDDIPGAALTEPLESHTVYALKWWLLCHGIKVPAPTAHAHMRLDFIFL